LIRHNHVLDEKCVIMFRHALIYNKIITFIYLNYIQGESSCLAMIDEVSKMSFHIFDRNLAFHPCRRSGRDRGCCLCNNGARHLPTASSVRVAGSQGKCRTELACPAGASRRNGRSRPRRPGRSERVLRRATKRAYFRNLGSLPAMRRSI